MDRWDHINKLPSKGACINERSELHHYFGVAWHALHQILCHTYILVDHHHSMKHESPLIPWIKFPYEHQQKIITYWLFLADSRNFIYIERESSCIFWEEQIWALENEWMIEYSSSIILETLESRYKKDIIINLKGFFQENRGHVNFIFLERVSKLRFY